MTDKKVKKCKNCKWWVSFNDNKDNCTNPKVNDLVYSYYWVGYGDESGEEERANITFGEDFGCIFWERAKKKIKIN